jgi:hypothetical protein
MIVFRPTEAITDEKDILIMTLTVLKEVSQRDEEREKPKGSPRCEGRGGRYGQFSALFKHWMAEKIQCLPLRC